MIPDNLIGLGVHITIGEPWDFFEEQGSGPFFGRIVLVDEDVLRGESTTQRVSLALVRLDATLVVHDTASEYFMAYPRHEGTNIESVATGSAVICNFVVVPENMIADTEPFTPSWWRAGISLIGQMRRA